MRRAYYRKLQTVYVKATKLLNEIESATNVENRGGDDDDAINAETFVVDLEHKLLVNQANPTGRSPSQPAAQ